MPGTQPGRSDHLLHPPARRPGHLRCPPRGCSAALRSVEAKRSFFLSVLPILIDGGPGATPGGFAGLRLRKLFQRRFAEKLCGPGIAPCPHTADPELHVRTEKKLSGATEGSGHQRKVKSVNGYDFEQGKDRDAATIHYAGLACGCGDYSCPRMHDSAARCVNWE